MPGAGNFLRQLAHLAKDPLGDFVRWAGDHAVDPGGHLAGLRLLHAATGDRGRAQPDARGVERLARVERHRVVVELDPRLVERLGGDLARDVLVRKVDQDEVVVGPARDHLVALCQ